MDDKIWKVFIVLLIFYMMILSFNHYYSHNISNFDDNKYDVKFLKKAKEVHNSNSKYNIRKTEIYNLAKKKAIETKKKLMVIGDPYSGSYLNRTYNYPIYGIPYGYGDLCIDLSGCPENPGSSFKGKLEDIIGNLNTNEFVIYISQTLEYIDSNILEYTLKHLIRVSGKDLFIVHMNYDNDTYVDRHGKFKSNNVFTKVPPYDNIIEYYYNNDKKTIYSIELDNININSIDNIKINKYNK